MKHKELTRALTVTANPAIDFLVTAPDWLRGRVSHGESAHMRPGGKGINVATALAQLEMSHKSDVHIIATGWLGLDNASVFRTHMQHHGIDDAFVMIPGSTRTNVKITDPHDNDTTDINFSGLQVTEDECQKLTDTLVQKDQSTLCVLAGSLPAGVTSTWYAELIPDLKAAGHVVVLDASGDSLKAVVESKCLPHVMKPNIHELRELTGLALESHEDIIAVAQQWFPWGLDLLVVSLGSEGALFITDNHIVTAQPPKVSVFSTVGAGDSMVAGIAYGFLHQLSLEEMASFATAVSVAKITKEQKGDTFADNVAHWQREITITSRS